jgi:two-component system chemotaxis sensor kinase CheA
MSDSDDMAREFVAEATTGLTRAERLLLHIEQDGAKPETLDDLFRVMHSIKGNASFLDLAQVVALAHAGETAMAAVRQERRLDGDLADLLLATVDRLKSMIAAPDLGAGTAIDDLLGRYAQPSAAVVPATATDVPTTARTVQPRPQQPVTSAVAAPVPPSSRPPAGAEATMRVPVRFLDDLLRHTGTMVMARNQLLTRHQFGDDVAFATLSRCIAEVHKSVVQSRMVPVSELFDRFFRVVRDLAKRLGKEVELQIDGAEIELDRTILESFADPMTHLVRNALDHAIETPAERAAAGKHRTGRLVLRAYQQSGEIIIEVEDDGRGIDPELVRRKAVEKGLLDPAKAAQLNRQACIELIMLPGFSTRSEATDLSGRGVDMDVVKTNIERIGGTIGIHTEPGTGTVFAFRLPMTQAIVSSSLISALVVVVGDQRYAIPESAVNEIIRIDPQDPADRITGLEGKDVYQLRNKVLSIIHLEDAFGEPRTFVHPRTGEVLPDRRVRVVDRRQTQDPAETARWAGRRSGQERRRTRQTLVVVEFRRSLFGLMVDRVQGIEEIVVRPTPALVKGAAAFAGHTVLGDGRVVLMLDLPGVVARMGLRFAEHEHEQAKRPRALRTGQQMVMFESAKGEHFAIPLMMISLIEKIPAKDIRRIGSREFYQLKQETIPLLRLDRHLDVSPLPETGDYHLLLPAHVHHPIGILAGADLRIIDVAERFDGRVEHKNGLVGTFLHQDVLVMLIDIYGLFAAAAPDHYSEQDRELGGPARILLAEDTLFFCKLMQQYLKHPGVELTVVYDGQQAWDLLNRKRERFDLILSDIEMPNMNGFDLVRNIKGHPELRQTPVIALTSLSDEESRRRGMKAGFDEYAVKIDKDTLLDLVFSHLRRRAQP